MLATIQVKLGRALAQQRLGQKQAALITRAFEAVHTAGLSDMLTVKEFIKHSGYSVDDIHVDVFYESLRNDLPIFVSDSLIEWMGFEGDTHKKRTHFIHALDQVDPTCAHHRRLSFDDFEQFRVGSAASHAHLGGRVDSNPSSAPDAKSATEPSDVDLLYPKQERNRFSVRRTYVLIEPDLLDEMLMKLKTSKGGEVRHHFIAIKALFRTYMAYQTVYVMLAGDLKLITLETMLVETRAAHEAAKVAHAETMTKLNGVEEEAKDLARSLIAMEDRLANAASDHIHPPADDKLSLVLALCCKDDTKLYCIIRTQKRTIERTLASRAEEGFDRVALRIDNCQGNMGTWNQFKARYSQYITMGIGMTFMLRGGMTEERFVKTLREFEMQRQNI